MSTSFFFQPNGPDYGMGSVNPAYDQHQAHRSVPGSANQQGHTFSEPPQNIHGLIHDRIQRLETQQAVDKALAEQSSRRLEEKLDKLMGLMQDRPPPTQSAPSVQERKELVIPQATPPLDRADYTNTIRFWDEAKWETYKKANKSSKTAFLQGEDGTYTSGTRLKYINTVAKQLWAELYAHRQDPPTWGQAVDTAALYFTRNMAARFIEFQLCDETGWKVQAYATAVFPDWSRGPRAGGHLRRNNPSVVSHVVYETSSRGHESRPKSSNRDRDRKRKPSRKDREDEPSKKKRREICEDTDKRRKGKEKEVVEILDDRDEDEGRATPVRGPSEEPDTRHTPLCHSPLVRSPVIPSRTGSLEPLSTPPASPAGSSSLTPPPTSPAHSENPPTPGPEPETELRPKAKNPLPRKSGRTGLNHLSKVVVPKTTITIQPPPSAPAAQVTGPSTSVSAKAPLRKDLMVANDSNSVQNLYARFLLETNPRLTKAEFKEAWKKLPEEDPKKYEELQAFAKAQRANAKASKGRPAAA